MTEIRLFSCKKQGRRLVGFLKRLKVEMGEFKYSEALEVEFFKNVGEPKPHMYKKGYCDSKQHVIINMDNIRESLELSQQEVLQKVANWMSEAGVWIVNQVRRHSIAPRIAKFNVWSC